MGKLAPRESESALLGVAEGQVRRHQREALARGPEKLGSEQINSWRDSARAWGAAGAKEGLDLWAPHRTSLILPFASPPKPTSASYIVLN